MADRGSSAEVEHTLREVRGAWYRAGVPRPRRRERTEELRAHLLETVEAGGTVQEVTGDDLAAFAAEWAAAERSHPVAELVLQAIAAVTLIPGVVALLNPWLSGRVWTVDDRVGIPVDLLAPLTIMVLFFVGLHILRYWRHRLDRRASGVVIAALLLLYAGGFGAWMAWGQGSGRLLPVAAIVAWSLVIVGTASQAIASWLKRRA